MNRIKCTTLFGMLMSGFFFLPTSAAEAVPFQQYRTGTCPTDVCFIRFGTVPAGQQRTARNMSYIVRLGIGSSLAYVALQARTANNAVIHSVILEPGITRGGPNQTVYNINDEVLAFANAGGYFLAQVGTFGPATGGILQADCGISGDQN